MDTEDEPRRGRQVGPRFSPEVFEQLVAQALDSLPAEIQDWLDNVAVVVAHRPSPAHLRQAGLRRGDLLLGLYVGVPKTRRAVTYGETVPDKILVFQRPIEAVCRTAAEVRQQVRRTVLHELGHHFGMDEVDLEQAGV